MVTKVLPSGYAPSIARGNLPAPGLSSMMLSHILVSTTRSSTRCN